jgi:hypothetical protein
MIGRRNPVCREAMLGFESGRFAPDQLNSKARRFGKQDRRFDSPHGQTGAVVSASVYFR